MTDNGSESDGGPWVLTEGGLRIPFEDCSKCGTRMVYEGVDGSTGFHSWRCYKCRAIKSRHGGDYKEYQTNDNE